jgi:hypothetical protein
VQGRLAQLTNSPLFPSHSEGGVKGGSGSPLHRDTHSCRSPVFLLEGSLTRDVAS